LVTFNRINNYSFVLSEKTRLRTRNRLEKKIEPDLRAVRFEPALCLETNAILVKGTV